MKLARARHSEAYKQEQEATADHQMALKRQRMEEDVQFKRAMLARADVLKRRATKLAGFELKYLGTPIDNNRLQTSFENFPNPGVDRAY